MARKKQEAEFNLFDELTRGIEEIADSDSGELQGIIDFINKRVDPYDMETLLGNRVVLKAFFNEPLDFQERAVLDQWVKEGKTNWRPLEDIARDENAARAIKGLPPKEIHEFEWRELIIEGGMRGGKTQIGAFINLFIFYRLVMTPREEWREKFGLNIPMGVPAYITCLAASADSTERTIYGQIKSYMEGSRWAKRLIEQKRLILTDSDIQFPESNLTIVAGNSKAAGQVGRMAFVVTFDEIAFHVNDQGKSNAKDLYDRLGRSTTNLGRAGKIIAISSVKEEGDFMEQLQRESWDKQHLGSLCFKLATWDLNETLSLDAPVIAKAYANDPVTAARDYENLRPAAEDAFLNSITVDQAISHQNDTVIKFHRDKSYIKGINEEGKEETRTFVTIEVDKVESLPAGFFSVAHCDPGLVQDSFALAVGHAESGDDGIITVIDFVIDWVPLRGPDGKPHKVDFINVENVILQLWKARNIMRMTFDHWQGEDHIQRLWRAGVPAREERFTRTRQTEGYMLFRDRLNRGLIKIPQYPVLIEELKQLVLKNGHTIDHPKKRSLLTNRPLSKDLADAIMMVDNYIAISGAPLARTPHQKHGIISPKTSFNAVGTNRTSQINWGFQ